MKQFTYVALFTLIFTLIACGDNKQQSSVDHSTMEHSKMDHATMESNEMKSEETALRNSSPLSEVINAYLNLKNALIIDDTVAAAKAGEHIALATSQIDKPELKAVLDQVQAIGTAIANEPLAGQRAQLELIYVPMTTLIDALGTSQTLYQQYCPMYNNNQGGSWLSTVETIENPYFGNKMLRCGSVKQTFAVR